MSNTPAVIKYSTIYLFFSFAIGAAFGQTKFTKISEQLVFNNPPFKNCHASTIVETKSGDILIACFGGLHEGSKDVGIWLSRVTGKGVTAPVQIADGIVNDTLRYPCWNPVLFSEKSGRMILFYKVGPNPREWWGMFKVSEDGGKTWSGAHRLPQGIIGPVKNKPVELANGELLCPSSVEYSNGKWRVFIERTDESLKNWSSIPVDTSSNFDVIQPSIIFFGGQKLGVLCRSKQGKVISAKSGDNGARWSGLFKTNLPNPNSGTDAVTLKSGKQLIVYNPDTPGKDWSDGRAVLHVAASEDGEHWVDVMTLEQHLKGEYSYPAIIQTRDNLIHITYTYDRQNIKHVVLKEQ